MRQLTPKSEQLQNFWVQTAAAPYPWKPTPVRLCFVKFWVPCYIACVTLSK